MNLHYAFWVVLIAELLDPEDGEGSLDSWFGWLELLLLLVVLVETLSSNFCFLVVKSWLQNVCSSWTLFDVWHDNLMNTASSVSFVFWSILTLKISPPWDLSNGPYKWICKIWFHWSSYFVKILVNIEHK